MPPVSKSKTESRKLYYSIQLFMQNPPLITSKDSIFLHQLVAETNPRNQNTKYPNADCRRAAGSVRNEMFNFTPLRGGRGARNCKWREPGRSRTERALTYLLHLVIKIFSFLIYCVKKVVPFTFFVGIVWAGACGRCACFHRWMGPTLVRFWPLGGLAVASWLELDDSDGGVRLI